MSDFPLAIPFEQSEYVGSPGIGSGQLTRPVLYLKMYDGDTLDDLDAGEAGNNIRCRTVFVDPLKHVFYRARILYCLTIA
jgi:hypothetical protein